MAKKPGKGAYGENGGGLGPGGSGTEEENKEEEHIGDF